MLNPFLLATTYGHKPHSTEISDEFKLRVCTGGLAGPNTADKCAAKALDRFKAENGYAAYDIVARESQWFPSGYDYRVRFRR
jgi:hypothetical protein